MTSKRTEERAPLVIRGGALPLGRRTYVMAIVNLTDDSFSGDGVGSDIDAALRRAATAVSDGADIIDIGAESARADVPAREAGEEAAFVSDAVRRIGNETGAVLSIDTYKGAVAGAALEAGAHIVNDIGGFMIDTGTAEAAAKHGAALVLNYTYERAKVRPAAPPRYDDLIGAHLAFLRGRMETAIRLGVREDSLIVDPGIAFGKSHDEDIETLRRLEELTALGRPLLVAASRKHFIGSIMSLPPDERDEATAIVSALNVAYGADIVRVHDVPRTVRAVRVADAIVRGSLGDFAATDESWPWWSEAEPIVGTTIRPGKNQEPAT